MATGLTVTATDRYVFRPVLAKIATLKEIRSDWNLADLAKAHQLLDLQEEAEEFDVKKQQAETKRGKR